MKQLNKRILKICLNKHLDYVTNLMCKVINVLYIKNNYEYILTFYHKNKIKYFSNNHSYSTRRYGFLSHLLNLSVIPNMVRLCLILQPFRRFTYVTAHSPTFCRFTYVTAHSTTLPLFHLRHLASRP